MKYIYTYVSILLLIMLNSCAKDKGNYDYSESERIEVKDMEARYAAVSLQDTLRIFPKATSNKEGELEYCWGILKGPSNAELDTIAKTADLNYYVEEDAKTWSLVLQVKNKKTGYTHYQSATLEVSTRFTRGWYVLKDDGSNADLDLFLTPKNYQIGDVVEDVYSFVNGKKLEGKASFMSFSTALQTDVLIPGTFAPTRSFFISTNNDIKALSINTLKDVRDKENFFLAGPQTINGGTATFNSGNAIFAFNALQLYSIGTSGPNFGRFGNRVMYDATNRPYTLSKYMISNTNGDPILFDDQNSSFVTLGNGSGSTLTVLGNVKDNGINTSNNNQRALYLGYKNFEYLPSPNFYYKTQGYAILEDKTDPSIRSLCFLDKDKLALTIKKESIEPSSKLYNGYMHSLLSGDENIMYFVNNNNIYSRNLSNANEQLQFAVPSSEEVTFIKHLKFSETSNPGYNFNYVIVGTKIGSTYKVRMFNKASGNLNLSPDQTITGQGTARGIIYIAPTVTEYTYPYSY